MKTVAKIIESYGGLEWLRQPGNYIRLENPPYMRLVIEHIGEGPRGTPAQTLWQQAAPRIRERRMKGRCRILAKLLKVTEGERGPN